MKYHKQSFNTCLAYSFLQIGRVKEAAVREYEKAVEAAGLSRDVVVNWLAKHVPEAMPAIEDYYANGFSRELSMPDVGTGALGVMFTQGWGWQGHAVSYENGVILDPGQDAPGVPETWEQFKERYAKVGAEEIRLAGVLPAKLRKR